MRSFKTFVLCAALIPISVILNSCTRELKIEPPSTSLNNSNVLQPVLEFNTKEDDSVYIEFWKSGSSRKFKTKKSKGNRHRIILMNLTEKATYKYQIVSLKSESRSKVFEYVTGDLPRELFRLRKELIDTTQFKGYVLVRRFFRAGVDAILNNSGDIVWYHIYDTVVRRPNRFTANGTILSIYDSAVLIETDLVGNTVFKADLSDKGVENKIHHEVLYDAKGNIVTLTLDSAEMDLRPFGGKKRGFLRADGILVVNKNGEKVWEWNMLDVATPDPATDSVNLKDSWGHANSLVIDDDGNYVISLRDLSQLWKINSTTGELMWRFGKRGDFDINQEQYPLRQHSITSTSDGDFIVFDNGSHLERPYSRIFTFNVNDELRTAVVKTVIDLSPEMTSYRMCSAEEIDSDKYLVCITRKDARVAVVDSKGKVTWEVILVPSSYRAYYISDPFEKYLERG